MTKILRACAVAAVLVLALLPALARANVSSDLNLAEPRKSAKPADVSFLVQLMNEFLEVDGKDPDEAKNLLGQIRREMKRLDQEGKLVEKFRPLHLTDNDIAEKIRSMSKYKKVAANSLKTTLAKTLDTALVCLTLVLGTCELKPELDQPSAITSQSTSGGSQ